MLATVHIRRPDNAPTNLAEFHEWPARLLLIGPTTDQLASGLVAVGLAYGREEVSARRVSTLGLFMEHYDRRAGAYIRMHANRYARAPCTDCVQPNCKAAVSPTRPGMHGTVNPHGRGPSTRRVSQAARPSFGWRRGSRIAGKRLRSAPACVRARAQSFLTVHGRCAEPTPVRMPVRTVEMARSSARSQERRSLNCPRLSCFVASESEGHIGIAEACLVHYTGVALLVRTASKRASQRCAACVHTSRIFLLCSSISRERVSTLCTAPCSSSIARSSFCSIAVPLQSSGGGSRLYIRLPIIVLAACDIDGACPLNDTCCNKIRSCTSRRLPKAGKACLFASSNPVKKKGRLPGNH